MKISDAKSLSAAIRERRKELENQPESVFEILRNGTEKARSVAKENPIKLKTQMGINYFNIK